MIFDMAMKLARKTLSQGFYNRLSYDFLGRRDSYERIETYAGIYTHYRDQGLDFHGKVVIEVGAGLQYFTALYFLSDGASRVLLVEPKLTFSLEALRKCLLEFNRNSGRILTEADVVERIQCFQDLSMIPKAMDQGADLLCSYTVLEHVRNLPDFFSQTARLLKPSARAYHMIDLSDHTYQVFARIPWASGLNSARALYHLRYSRRTFAMLNDPKCYMNRVLMPAYLELARKNGFKIAKQVTNPYPGEVRIHPELLNGAVAGDSELNITTLSLTLEKSG